MNIHFTLFLWRKSHIYRFKERRAAWPSGESLDGEAQQVAEVVGPATHALAAIEPEGDGEELAVVAQADTAEGGTGLQQEVAELASQGGGVGSPAMTGAAGCVETQGVGVECGEGTRFVG